MSKLIIICAWCPDNKEQTENARAHGFDVTHGMCPACKAKWGDTEPDTEIHEEFYPELED